MPTFNATSPIVDDPNGAVTLNGTSDYASKAVTTYGSTHSAGSVAGWVKTSATSGDLVIFAVADTATANEAFFFQVDSTNGKLAVGTIIGGTTNEVRGSTTINDDVWHYVTATTNGTAWSLYVDGVAETLTATSGTNDGSWWFDLAGADNITLGALVQNTTSGHYTSGLDEVALWDYQISGDEVFDHYTEGLRTYTPAVPQYYVNGIVYDDTGAPCARTVRIYNRATGALIAEVESNATTGAYSFELDTQDEVQRIALDNSAGELYNDVIDRIIPGSL